MKTSLIKIGNSRGIRLPKSYIEDANLRDEITITLHKDSIVIRSATPSINEEATMSEKALLDWLKPEEDDAWKHIQPAK